MPSLDPLQKRQRPSAKKPAARPPTPVQPSIPRASSNPDYEKPRTTLMWTIIGILMAVILACWIVVFRVQGPKGGSTTNPLTSFFNQVGDLFKKESAASSNTNADNQQFQDLRDRVFPEFTNTAE